MKPHKKQHDYWKECSVQLSNEKFRELRNNIINYRSLTQFEYARFFFSFHDPQKINGIYSKDEYKKTNQMKKEFLQKQESVYEIEVRNDTGTNCERNVDESVLISMESEWRNRWSSIDAITCTHNMVMWSKQNQNAFCFF